MLRVKKVRRLKYKVGGGGTQATTQSAGSDTIHTIKIFMSPSNSTTSSMTYVMLQVVSHQPLLL